MIIGIDAHMLGDYSGGNESYYTNILLNMDIRDNVVYLFVNKNGNFKIYEDIGFKIVEFQEKNAFKRNFIEIPRLCKKYKLDILHMQYFIPFIKPCPIVCTIHDICFEHYRNIFTFKEYLRQKILIPYAAKKSKYIFTVSNYSKKDIANTYHIDESKIIVTYNAVNNNFKKLNKKKFNEKKLREKYGIGKFKYILSVGNLQPRKNLSRLIKAYCLLKKEMKEVKLVIVGKKAWMYEKILNIAVEDQNDIIFTNYVSNEDLVELYNAAYCFVYPSFFEGFGIPPLESMACGTPVAVSKCTSLPEVVGNAGLYFDPYDVDDIKNKIKELIINKKLCSSLIKKGMKQIKKFNWKESADKIVDVYLSIK